MGSPEVNRLPSEGARPLADPAPDRALRHAIGLVTQRAQTLREGVTVPSPCISICRMNAANGLCEGCFRTGSEIAVWSGAGDDDKRRIWRAIAQRMAMLEAGGPSAEALPA